jgi:hypothetical protein
MKAITYVINGNRFLTLKTDFDVLKLNQQYDSLSNRDFWIRVWNNNPFFSGFDTNKLLNIISQIEDVDISTFKFPTEHPRINLEYLEHPICDNIFIPVDNYNKYVQDERKWEIIRLLNNAGAKKVIFKKTQDISSQSILDISNYVFKNEIIEYYAQDEEYEFDHEQTDEFSPIWVNVEPEWNGIIRALNHGLKRGEISFTTEVSSAALMNYGKNNIQGNKTVKVAVSKIIIEK